MWKSQWKWLAGLAGVFALCYWLPVGTARFDHAVLEALELTGTCAAVPDSGSLHCRGDRSIRKSGRGNALSRTESEKGDGLRGSFSFRLHSGGLLLYDSAAFRRNL